MGHSIWKILSESFEEITLMLNNKKIPSDQIAKVVIYASVRGTNAIQGVFEVIASQSETDIGENLLKEWGCLWNGGFWNRAVRVRSISKAEIPETKQSVIDKYVKAAT